MAQDRKRSAIHAAAISEFSERGFAGTSMANIAAAADMSRPALYQYFDNKADIFASAFTSLIEEHVDQALAALASESPVAVRLDGFLQRFEGDLWYRLAASPHSEEIMQAKNSDVTASVGAAVTRLWDGLQAYLLTAAPAVDATQRADWIDVLHLSPKGFKLDQPSIDTFRRRLSTLARSIGLEIEKAEAP